MEKNLSENKCSLVDSFLNFNPSRQRFQGLLKETENFKTLTKSPESSIRDIILRFVLDDHMNVMSELREVLDFIDEHMSDDDILRICLQDWRNLLGRWKSSLSRDIGSITYLTQKFLSEPGIGKNDVNAVDSSLNPICRNSTSLRPTVQADFNKLRQGVNSLAERARSTFQALMATMAIVESQKAIVQAESLSRLTSLAFFFIPLMFISSIIGMNIVVIKHISFNLRKAEHTLTFSNRNGIMNQKLGFGLFFRSL